MSISNYSELKTAVANWMDRTDLDARIPEFIALAEAKYNRDLNCIQMDKRSVATVNLSSSEPQYIALPDDFNVMKRLRITSVQGRPILSYRNPTQLAEFIMSRADATGQPVYFTVFGPEMELAPIPDQAYTLEMTYKRDLPALSDTQTTNWLLTQAPDAYLYGALLESEPFLKNDARLPMWTAARSFVVDQLNRQSQDNMFGASPIQMTVSGYTP